MAPAPKKILLVGPAADALEAKRVVLERAGYVVRVFASGGSVRGAAEEMDASLVIIDTSSGGPDVRAALGEMSGEKSGGREPSTIPVLVIGPEDLLSGFDGPGAALPKPAQKRALLESTRILVEGIRDGARRKWRRGARRGST